MKLKLKESTSERGKMTSVTTQDLGVDLPDRIILTDNGVYDLEKQGINGYYTWVGYQHKGSRSEAKMAKEVARVANDIIAPALVDMCQDNGIEVYDHDVEIEDYINSLDMYRVWICTDTN